MFYVHLEIDGLRNYSTMGPFESRENAEAALIAALGTQTFRNDKPDRTTTGGYINQDKGT